MQEEAKAARTIVRAACGRPGGPPGAGARLVRGHLGSETDVAEQSREQRPVDRGVARGVDRGGQREVERPTGLAQRGDELRVDVTPFGEPQERHVMRAAREHALAVRQRPLRGAVEEFPQRDQREKIRACVAELQVRLVRRLRALERPLAGIGHRQRARDHERLGEATVLARGEDDAPHARVERQARELASPRGQRARLVDGLELLQQLVAVGDRAR